LAQIEILGLNSLTIEARY